ncbi:MULTISPECIES: NAD(P)/FAD-dependent oxidoreductase [Cyanophyceae]|uniref:FAD-dependent oxidoreductase n=1 Tax=Cyanophyceae TaxID=3028117 RepID=UPI001687E689|nr:MULTISPECIES: NAD(P)/FAD-dependent oxidoreductase [Cyanophyceae]MBD1914684.1 FAD-dependent monooxygenase [Phormidium sp. FACHB-77]MBD2032572.1 FAD-dependent monooxygenase [Phormidium sp. FACHB-322]MBD2049430.1 FAD-dependent monooxygenase [Leptolyngbya sp. FACHB-60]
MIDTSSQTIVIVGAGPAGLLLAHYLLRRGDRVQIYDRRPDPRQVAPDQQRSFPISLQYRGRRALQGIPGLEEAIAEYSVMCQGTYLHRKGKTRRILRKHPILTIDRNRLVLVLLEQLVARYPDPARLSLTFDCTCQGVDSQTQTVSFQAADGQSFTVNYDRLVGADGAKSCVRAALVAEHGLNCQQTYVPDAYKSIFLARTNPQQGVELAPDFIHACNMGGDARILLAPQPGDQMHGAFIFNAKNSPFDGLKTKADVLDYFAARLPTFRSLLSEAEAEALLQRPTARLTTVTCDRFHHGDRILILGDAAHAVSPSIGQGCNSALQDVEWLNQLLDQYQDDWSQVLPQFSQQRVVEAHALRDLSDYSFPRSKALVLEFFLRLTVGRKLHQWFPKRFSPFVFDLVLDTDLNYSEVLRRSQGWINKVKRSMLAEPAPAQLSQSLTR